MTCSRRATRSEGVIGRGIWCSTGLTSDDCTGRRARSRRGLCSLQPDPAQFLEVVEREIDLVARELALAMTPRPDGLRDLLRIPQAVIARDPVHRGEQLQSVGGFKAFN